VTQQIKPVRLGIAGLGMAGAVMVHAAAAHPAIKLAGAADPHAAPRAAFTADTGAPAYDDLRALCDDPAIEAIYIATPHQFHAGHVRLAAQAGKHIIVEKPLALTLEDCAEIVACVAQHQVRLIVGHTHAFDPAIRLMRRLIAGGMLGRLGLVSQWNFTNYLYRPRRPEELDTAQGGGIVFNQMPHQIDIARLLGGGLATSVRAHLAVLDEARPTEGLGSALLQFANGAAASLVYSGADHFDADELHGWVAESGAEKQPGHGAARRALAARQQPETELRTAGFAYGATAFAPRRHQPHFGLLVASCAGGDLRPSADGVMIYDQDGAREIAIPCPPGVPGRHEVLDDLVAALRHDAAPLHDAAWGMATVEVALALLVSAREGREVTLHHQVATNDGG
jgi:phthalate 4,5-cis-dihydrodiol dehydrogenase